MVFGNAAPGAEVDFVNGDGRFEPVFLVGAARSRRSRSTDVVSRLPTTEPVLGRSSRAKGVGIGFEREKIALRADDFVFVDGAFADFGEEKLPDSGRAARTHGMDAAVPVIHVADDADAFGGGRPDGEMRSGGLPRRCADVRRVFRRCRSDGLRPSGGDRSR